MMSEKSVGITKRIRTIQKDTNVSTMDDYHPSLEHKTKRHKSSSGGNNSGSKMEEVAEEVAEAVSGIRSGGSSGGSNGGSSGGSRIGNLRLRMFNIGTNNGKSSDEDSPRSDAPIDSDECSDRWLRAELNNDTSKKRAYRNREPLKVGSLVSLGNDFYSVEDY